MNNNLKLLGIILVAITLMLVIAYGVKDMFDFNYSVFKPEEIKTFGAVTKKPLIDPLKTKVDDLKAKLKDKVKTGELTQSEFNELVAVANEVSAFQGGLQLSGNITLESILNSL